MQPRSSDHLQNHPTPWVVRKRGEGERSALTCIVWKCYIEVDSFDFLFEQIDLVEEEDESGVGKPRTVADLIEQKQGLWQQENIYR